MSEDNEKNNTFLNRILSMINEAPTIINWSKDGKQIVIFNIQSFENLLKNYYGHKHLKSFIRQLNMYNFHKVCRDKRVLNFKNELFFKGNENNFHQIKRRNIKQQQKKQTLPIQKQIISVLQQKYDSQYPQFSKIIEQLIVFKSRSDQTMSKLRINLDILGKQLNQRSGKQIKKQISEVKQIISSIQDSSSMLENKMHKALKQQMTQKTLPTKQQQTLPTKQQNKSQKVIIQQNHIQKWGFMQKQNYNQRSNKPIILQKRNAVEKVSDNDFIIQQDKSKRLIPPNLLFSSNGSFSSWNRDQ